MTLKNLLVCAFAATMSFMTTNAFAADDYVVVKTTYDDPDGTLIDWDNEQEFGGFKGIELGDKVRITTDIIDADPQLQIVVKVGSAWTWTEFISETGYIDIPNNGILEFDIKDYPNSKNPVTGDALVESLSELNRPLLIKGQSVMITKIEVLRKASDIKEYETVISTDITNGEVATWNDMVTIPASAFTGLKVGDIIDLNLDSKAGAQIQYAVKKDETDAGWTQLVDYADVAEIYTINVEGTITNKQTPAISISAADFVTAATSYGMFLKGHDYTVKSVVVKRLKTNGIGSINADNNIDENKPVEIYSIDGRKMQNTNVHGIYILRQGNKTIKVMK